MQRVGIEKSIEMLANLTVIACGIWAVSTVAEYRRVAAQNPQHALTAGEKISIEAVNFATTPKTLILALQQGCGFCTASMEFYRRLGEQVSRNRRVQIVAVLPNESADARRYLGEYGVRVNDVRRVSFPSINVSGTPTLILVDHNGAVERIWVGQLPKNQEAEVTAALL